MPSWFSIRHKIVVADALLAVCAAVVGTATHDLPGTLFVMAAGVARLTGSFAVRRLNPSALVASYAFAAVCLGFAVLAGTGAIDALIRIAWEALNGPDASLG